MQAVAVRNAQKELVASATDLWVGKISGNLSHQLHEYCIMLRDLDYMEEKAKKGYDADPFLLQTDKRFERDMMLRPAFSILLWCLHSYQMSWTMTSLAYQGWEETHGSAKKKLEIDLWLWRVPWQELVTTSVFVLAFALGGALFSDLKPAEILAVTAGYAAVLVVFVGSSQRNTS
ncbi:hypothetical protein LTR78_008071 [Recurvomyces mirabilis]|uniref:Uncharacterized protein n=1 Tax=Recurvomyces mirabilis TaxID=574656 RepID=A0AAE0TU96_9PEZI|nr:hypothetical protein LTR78_008071 [Recurvomyces mirabilis]KAK5150798.1 hypothetical protein LTS14_009862 [Recurvomyces mirabilis]